MRAKFPMPLARTSTRISRRTFADFSCRSKTLVYSSSFGFICPCPSSICLFFRLSISRISLTSMNSNESNDDLMIFAMGEKVRLRSPFVSTRLFRSGNIRSAATERRRSNGRRLVEQTENVRHHRTLGLAEFRRRTRLDFDRLRTRHASRRGQTPVAVVVRLETNFSAGFLRSGRRSGKRLLFLVHRDVERCSGLSQSQRKALPIL